MSEPIAINAMLAEFEAALRSWPAQTCTACGENYRGVAGLCWDCEQAEIKADEERRAAEAVLSGIDAKWRTVNLGDYDCPPGDAEALAAIRAWDGTTGLYVHGTPGGGKSHLAFARVRELIRDGRKVFAADWASYLRRIRRTFDQPGEKEHHIADAITKADIVLIDDLGAGSPTPWAAEQLWSLVNGRYAAGLPLVVTSNLPLGALAAKFKGADGDRVASRLAEMSPRIQVKARDYRVHGDRP